MLFAETAAITARAAAATSRAAALAILRELPLDDFGAVLLDPAAHELSHFLPAMPADEVQIRWTGSAGADLLPSSLAFMRTLENLHARFRRRALHGRRILDYGCGWGRLLRLALYYSDPDDLVGADAWDSSLQHCRDAMLPARLVKTPTRPSRADLRGPIDIAYSFSVFTHVPADVGRAILKAIRGAISDDGLLALTFRPLEYWDVHTQFDFVSRDALVDAHIATGFAFQRGEDIREYGDASCSHAYVDRMLEECGWRRVAFDRNIGDPLQEIVAAVPA